MDIITYSAGMQVHKQLPKRNLLAAGWYPSSQSLFETSHSPFGSGLASHRLVKSRFPLNLARPKIKFLKSNLFSSYLLLQSSKQPANGAALARQARQSVFDRSGKQSGIHWDLSLIRQFRQAKFFLTGMFAEKATPANEMDKTIRIFIFLW